MLDLLESVRKMIAAARREVVIYWHAGPQAWDVEAAVLWPLLHGRAFSPIPKADIVFNLLYSLGIYPDVRSIPSSFVTGFRTMDEAVEAYGRRFEAPEGVKRQALREYLERTLISTDAGFEQRDKNTGMRISFHVTSDLDWIKDIEPNELENRSIK
jgi:hypothetical protein